MIPLRRHRYTALTIILTGLVIWYLATAQDSTRNSPFYQKTAAAIGRRRNEGPQAPGSAQRQYLKGGSIRPSEQQIPIDTSPIDDTEDAMRHQLGADTDVKDQVEGLDRGLETADADSRAGTTAGDIELEKQIIQARKREQEKLKNELRDQLKHKERERQKSLSAKYTNPNWVGAFEKEQKPPAILGALELEKAPDLDPFRDGPAAAPYQAPVPIVREQAPAVDPFRDKPAHQPYQAPVPVGGASMDTQTQVEQKIEQQQGQLVMEQEYLDPVRPAAVKQSTVKVGKPKRPVVMEEEVEDQEYLDAVAAAPVRQPAVKVGKPRRPAAIEQQLEDHDYLDIVEAAPVKQSTAKGGKPKRPAAIEEQLEDHDYLDTVEAAPIKQPRTKGGKPKRPAVVEEDQESADAYTALEAATRANLALSEDVEEDVRPVSNREHDPFIDAVVKGREARQASEALEMDEGEYVPDRHAYKVTEHESGHQAKMGRDDADVLDTEDRPIKGKTTTTVAAAAPRPTKKKAKAAADKTTTPSKSDPTGPPAHKTPAELELSRLLALSPITIFSKTHCPHSKKAKRILTQAFQIMPSPYIVELDTHEHGPELQKLLKQKTGRGTVPNIIVNGKSLGGGDEVESLWQRGELRDKLRQMGGNRILSVEELEIE